jgi:hypothetical protein
MLVNTQLAGFGGLQSTSPYLYDIIQELGLTSNLVLCLDAADTRSYDGSSQTWTDIAAGNNFFRGDDGTSEAFDPAFNGTAGVADEGTYFSSNGNDSFTETTTHSFAETWHKNNGLFTIAAVIYTPGSQCEIFSNSGASFVRGIDFHITSSETLMVAHATSDAGHQQSLSTITATSSSYNFVAASFDEADLSLDFVVNSSSENVAINGSTATSDSNASYKLGARGDLSVVMPSGMRYPCVAAWSTDLSTAALGDIYTRLKARRFTSLP